MRGDGTEFAVPASEAAGTARASAPPGTAEPGLPVSGLPAEPAADPAPRPVPPVHGLFRHAQRRADGVPGEAKRPVEVDRRRDQGFHTLAQLLREPHRGRRSPAVHDEAGGRVGAARTVDIAQLGGEGA
jgi:hypothetical protein